ncbi:putative UbiX-like flavin prenyltransferase [Vibrio inusitatus NBRC 102082]|uniref:Flavin prenyltransferase UbiX n=1 Tax=Vibrio inusitatus NBRC 102082 TaxID=1219070 RepID=A0A4Y3I1D0_9VIBR|nr:UbiX family flavin prenyltransferase [Vibrio inusitatus]GEA52274.1 putative UbiX-like flavin prenyltransferase [Vibrio inusitatus NBRC 102082]
MRVVVGITGATGAPLALKVLQLLNDLDVETHVIISKWAKTTIELETDYSVNDFKALATVNYSLSNQAAAVSSGSFNADAMIVVPCSMKTLAAIRCGFADNLISRTADVMLKEQRKLILAVRETPLNSIHLDNMLYLSKLGVSICPPMPAFYNRPKSIDDILTHNAVRILDQINLNHPSAKRWKTED